MFKPIIPDTTAMLVLPRLAQEIGLEQALVLQQVHYWLCKCGKEIKGKRWIYNTLPQWHEQFKFWSVCKLQRIILALEKSGYLETGKFHRNKFNQTKWLTISEEKLAWLRSKFGAEEPISVDKITQIPAAEITSPLKSNDRTHQVDMIYNVTKTTLTNTNYLGLTVETDSNDISIGNVAQKLLDIWEAVLKERIVPTDKRIKQLNHLWKNVFNEGLDKWEEFCEKVKSSNFLQGRVNKFKAYFDWVIKEPIASRILAGEFGVANIVSKKQAAEIAQVITANKQAQSISRLKAEIEDKARKMEALAVQDVMDSWGLEQEKQAKRRFETFISDTSNPSFKQFREGFKAKKWNLPGVDFLFEIFISEHFLGKSEAAYLEEAFTAMGDTGYQNYQELCKKISKLASKGIAQPCQEKSGTQITITSNFTGFLPMPLITGRKPIWQP